MTFKCFSLTNGIFRPWFGPISLVGLQTSFKPIELSSVKQRRWVSREVTGCLIEDEGRRRVCPSLFLQLSTFTSLSSKAAGRWFNFTPSICHFLSESSQPSCPADATASACSGAVALSHLPAVCSSADPACAIFLFFSCFVANVQKQRMHHQMRCT